jgi:transcriptional regulator with XRE-family HTH domain
MPEHVIRVTRLKLLLLTQEEKDYVIAAAAGIHPSTLSLYSRGAKEISAKHLIALCDLFNVEPEAIIGWTEVAVA